VGETRIELKHLLEDLRDAYPWSEDEIVVTELIANALDSKASRLAFTVDVAAQTLALADDGRGMTAKGLKSYHDIAATTKTRGRGIGFAGVGSKLALLSADHVVTETRHGRYHRATRWCLETPRRAPWHYVPPRGLVPGPTGTAVTIAFRDRGSPLLKASFVERTIQEHFQALLLPQMGEILRIAYPKGVAISVNGRPVPPPETGDLADRTVLWVRAPGVRRLAGYGFVGRAPAPLADALTGIAVSAYGKTIKRGWEWLGITPRNPATVTGLVEVPQLVELLNTSKSDFLKDSRNLPRYYRLRKGIQAAVEPVLKSMGELAAPPPARDREAGDFGRRFERVLDGLLADFPELSPLLGRRLAGRPGADAGEGAPEEVRLELGEAAAAESAGPPEKASEPPVPPPPGGPDEVAASARRSRRPTMKIVFADEPDREEMARLEEDTIVVNRKHPAWSQARGTGDADYHVAVCIAWVLAEYLPPEKPPRRFIDRFLARWGDTGG
jgi:hypothetical protein